MIVAPGLAAAVIQEIKICRHTHRDFSEAKSFTHIPRPPSTPSHMLQRVRTLLEAGEREMPLVGESGTVWGMALVPKEEEGKKVGVVTNPVFVSVGHRLSLETCVTLTKAVGRCAFSF